MSEPPVVDWDPIAERALGGAAPSRDEALAVMRAPDAEVLPLLHAAYRVRRRFHGNRVRLHVLLNAKSGMCPEDCAFCSQSGISKAPIPRHRMLSKEQIVAAARRAREARAWKFCIVTSTRGPNAKEIETVCEAVREIRRDVGLRVCASLGTLSPDQAGRLKEAGVGRFNHNLETSERRFREICATHEYADRVRTIQAVQQAGMETCCGGIVGMGETAEDVVDLAFALRDLGVDSIPVNFLDPRPGTPLEKAPPPSPAYGLKALCLFRLVNPSRDIRAAGGRETCLRELQPLALFPCSSIFTSGYLTTPGNAPERDAQMIRDLGFEIEWEPSHEEGAEPRLSS